jgi:hypothetical protein
MTKELTKNNIKLQINSKEEFIKVYDILHKYNQPIDEDMNKLTDEMNQIIFLVSSGEWALKDDFLQRRTSVDFETFENILKKTP